jgi:hypothetical protein
MGSARDASQIVDQICQQLCAAFQTADVSPIDLGVIARRSCESLHLTLTRLKFQATSPRTFIATRRARQSLLNHAYSRLFMIASHLFTFSKSSSATESQAVNDIVAHDAGPDRRNKAGNVAGGASGDRRDLPIRAER